MSHSLRWSRCALAIVLAMPACSLLAQVPGGQQLARPFRASQMMQRRVAQMPSADPDANVIYDGVGPAPQMYGPQDEGYDGPMKQPRNGPYDGGPYGDGCGCGDACDYGPDGCGGYGGGYHGGGYGGDCYGGCSEGCYDGYGGDCCNGYHSDACGDCCNNYGHAGCSWSVDWLYLRASGADVAHAQQQNGIGGVGTVPFGEVGSVETEYDCGVRIGMNLASGPCSSVLVSYTFYETDGFNGVQPPDITGGGGAVGSLVHHPGAAITASAGPVLATYEIDFQLVDILYRSSLSAGPCHSVNYLLGFQYGNLEQNFAQSGVFSGGQQGVIDTYSTIDFDGGGLKAGLDVDRRLHGGFSAYGRITGAVMAGQFGTSYNLVNSTTQALLARAEWEDDRIVSHLEYEVGFGWTCPSERWRIVSGYMFSHWMNAVTTPVFIDAVQADNYTDVSDTISFDGFVTRLECCW